MKSDQINEGINIWVYAINVCVAYVLICNCEGRKEVYSALEEGCKITKLDKKEVV